MVELAGIARKDGMMALEGQDVPDKFLPKACKCWWMALMKASWFRN